MATLAHKISPAQARRITEALTRPSYELSPETPTVTWRALITHGLAYHGQLRERVTDERGHLVRSHGVMLTDEGVKEAKRLAGESTITREDVARAAEDAIQWVPRNAREEWAAKPAAEVLAREVKRARQVWRRLAQEGGRIPVETQALEHFTRTQELADAARRFEQEDAAQEAAQEGSKVEQQENEPREFRGLTRADVAHDTARALETLSAEDRATVEGKAPSVVLGLAFRRAQKAYCADRRTRTQEEKAAYERCANIASAALIFERADDPEAAATARADDFRITNAERAEEAKRAEEARAWALEVEWRGAERHGKYLIRTQDRGHGIIAVYARGPESDMASIDRAANQYARQNLTFQDGLSAGAVTSGGEMFRGEWIAQQVYTTKRLAPRED
jgi:hypothetical protein